jgi:hypothetical protein
LFFAFGKKILLKKISFLIFKEQFFSFRQNIVMRLHAGEKFNYLFAFFFCFIICKICGGGFASKLIMRIILPVHKQDEKLDKK